MDHCLFLPSADWRRFKNPDLLPFPDCTLTFEKELMLDHAPYESVDITENMAFVRALKEDGVRIEYMENEGTFVYVRHPKALIRWDESDSMVFDTVARPPFFSEGLEAVFKSIAQMDQAA
jgi:hypothetical protein